MSLPNHHHRTTTSATSPGLRAHRSTPFHGSGKTGSSLIERKIECPSSPMDFPATYAIRRLGALAPGNASPVGSAREIGVGREERYRRMSASDYGAMQEVVVVSLRALPRPVRGAVSRSFRRCGSSRQARFKSARCRYGTSRGVRANPMLVPRRVPIRD